MGESVGQANHFESGHRASMALGAGKALIEKWNFDIFHDGQFADQIEGLENESNAAASGPTQCRVVKTRHVDAIEQILAVGRSVETAQQIHEGALAASARAHDGAVLARRDHQIDASQGFDQNRPVWLEVVLLEASEDRRWGLLVGVQ